MRFYFFELIKTVMKTKKETTARYFLKLQIFFFLCVGGREEGGGERWEHFVQVVGSCCEPTVRHITFKLLKVGRHVC